VAIEFFRAIPDDVIVEIAGYDSRKLFDEFLVYAGSSPVCPTGALLIEGLIDQMLGSKGESNPGLLTAN
jgi:hypothetical protein